jgi:hypothetical protein
LNCSPRSRIAIKWLAEVAPHIWIYLLPWEWLLHCNVLLAQDDYIDVSVNFSVPIDQTEDLCENITIQTDSVLEDPELFLVDLDSSTVELCTVHQAFIQIIDSTREYVHQILITEGP